MLPFDDVIMISDFVDIAVPADGLAALDTRTSAGTVMTRALIQYKDVVLPV